MPAIVLFLFFIAEAILKKQFAPFFPFLNIPALFVLAGASVYLVHYFSQSQNNEPIWKRLKSPDRWPFHVWLLIAVFCMGFFLRLWHLGSLQEGMTYDEAYKGLDGIAIREFGERPVFLNWNGGREALVAYLVASSQLVLDQTISSVRIVTAITACLALVFFYLLTNRMYGPRIALLSTFLMAVSKWAIIHGRYGVRAGQYLVYEVAILYFVLHGLLGKKHNRISIIFAGVLCALGFYTYIAFRIFPLVVLALILQKPVRDALIQHWKSIAAGTICFLIVLAPTAVYYIQNMNSLTDRMQRTQVWRQKGSQNESPAFLVMESAARTFGMFNYSGDSIARHNVQEEPMLSPFVSGFFLLGFLFLLANPSKRYSLWLLLYLLISLIPGILSVGAPNAPRVLGCLPPVFLMSGIGMLAAFEIIQSERWRILKGLLPGIVLAGAFLTGVQDAFFRYPQQLDTLSTKISALWGMDRDQTQIAFLINRLGERCHVYLSPMYFFHSTVEYLTYEKSEHSLIVARNPAETLRREKIAVVIFQPEVINPWWLRDDDGKMFFKWWRQRYGMDVPEIRKLNRSSYEGVMTKASDQRLVVRLKSMYPKAREIRLGRYSALLFQP